MTTLPKFLFAVDPGERKHSTTRSLPDECHCWLHLLMATQSFAGFPLSSATNKDSVSSLLSAANTFL